MGASQLYPSHVRLSELQKGALLIGSLVGAYLRPARADLVATVGELTGTSAFRRMHNRMQTSPSGRDVLAERPRVTVRFSI